MPRSAWAVEPREETGDGTESSAMLDRGSGPPGSRRYVIEGNTCLLRLYIARLIYHACFRTSFRHVGGVRLRGRRQTSWAASDFVLGSYELFSKPKTKSDTAKP